ncbi:MAG: metallophosphoesterase family protein [Verrucomicrobiota bacterium]
MDRIFGICSDIHGNWEALQAVLHDMESHGVTQKICLGDIVGYGADPERCVRQIKDNDWVVLTGNHEEGLIYPEMLEYFNDAAVAGILWSREQIGSAELAWLSGLPHVIRGSSYELVHASLDEPMNWEYVMSRDEAERHFDCQQSLACFCGHTHSGMIWRKGRRIYSKIPTARKFSLPDRQKVLINVGSVGQPRDGNPKASYVLFKPEQRTVQFRRVQYDVESAKAKILRAGLPSKLGERLVRGT